MKGEQLNNFIEHHLPSLDPATGTSGETSSPSSPGLSPRVPDLTGSAMDSETQVYRDWANRARQRRGIPVNGVEWNPPLSEIGDAEEILDDPLEDSSPVTDPVREKKQRKLWAYRQRQMTWSNPYTWSRPAFRRKLNQRFVESLMMWPPIHYRFIKL
jgi:hypothetical protein